MKTFKQLRELSPDTHNNYLKKSQRDVEDREQVIRHNHGKLGKLARNVKSLLPGSKYNKLNKQNKGLEKKNSKRYAARIRSIRLSDTEQ